MVKVNSPECEFKKSKFESFCSLYQLEFPKEYIEYLKKYNLGNKQICSLTKWINLIDFVDIV